jgi:hypothetical protein
LRVTYKSFPLRNPGVPEQTRVWRPILTVKIIYQHATSKRFDAIVDTGSDYCLFNANIGASIGVKIINGPEGPLGGIIPGSRGKVYYHNIKLVVGSEIIDIKAGFSWDITENILGHFGFFENFIVTLDTAFEPPCFDIERAKRH